MTRGTGTSLGCPTSAGTPPTRRRSGAQQRRARPRSQPNGTTRLAAPTGGCRGQAGATRVASVARKSGTTPPQDGEALQPRFDGKRHRQITEASIADRQSMQVTSRAREQPRQVPGIGGSESRRRTSARRSASRFRQQHRSDGVRMRRWDVSELDDVRAEAAAVCETQVDHSWPAGGASPSASAHHHDVLDRLAAAPAQFTETGPTSSGTRDRRAGAEPSRSGSDRSHKEWSDANH